MEELLKKVLYTGVGMVAYTSEKVQKIVSDLVSQSKISEEEGKKIVEDFMKDSEGKREEIEAKVKEVAAKENVLFIDLDTKSRELYQQFGKGDSKLLFLQLKPGEHPNYPDGKEDNTHFNELGARLIAQLVLKEIKTTIPELAERIIAPVKK